MSGRVRREDGHGRSASRMRSTPSGDIRIGVSGWRYPPWRGVFYPAKLPQRLELSYAARIFRSIELNGSFYSLQRPESYAAWHDATPDDFVFAVKGARYITHMLQLRNVEHAMANFFASGIARLRHKLGPILWQLPPRMLYRESVLLHFLAQLPHDTDEAASLARRHNDKVAGRTAFDFVPSRRIRHALEIRNASFVHRDLIALLRELGIALVIADTGARWPEYQDVTADFVYVRLHGAEQLYVSEYTQPMIEQWAARIRAWSRGAEPDDASRITGRHPERAAARDVFCYFDNTDKQHAPRNAQTLMTMLGVEPPSK